MTFTSEISEPREKSRERKGKNNMKGTSSVFRFKIAEMINRYPAEYRARIKAMLCKELNIAESTWSNWANLRLDATYDPPYWCILHIEQRFGLKPGELANFTVKASPLNLSLFGLENTVKSSR